MMENVNNFLTEIIDEDIAAGLTEKIHTRFPPEPNGYLHIGSAKAIFINWSISKKYGGKFNLRYDDTNPVKEDTEYVDSIWEDINWLTGEEPSGGVFYGSDYFETCYECAVQLIKDGKAYVDDLTQDELREYRGTLTELSLIHICTTVRRTSQPQNPALRILPRCIIIKAIPHNDAVLP